MHTRKCACIHTCVPPYTCTNMYTYMAFPVNTSRRSSLSLSLSFSFSLSLTHAHAHTHMHTHTHAHAHTHMHAHTHAHSHTHTCICVCLRVYTHLYICHVPLVKSPSSRIKCHPPQTSTLTHTRTLSLSHTHTLTHTLHTHTIGCASQGSHELADGRISQKSALWSFYLSNSVAN